MTDAAFAALLVSSACAVATRLLYHISFRLSRGFWKVFQFFWSSFRSSSFERNVGCQLFSADLVIIPQCFPFVKRFFKSFLKTFFRFAFSLAAPFRISFAYALAKSPAKLPNSRDFSLWFLPFFRQLEYYTTSSLFCQYLFAKFFKKLQRFFDRILADSPFFVVELHSTTFLLICQYLFQKNIHFSKLFSVEIATQNSKTLLQNRTQCGIIYM